jgi:hypothetical protein
MARTHWLEGEVTYVNVGPEDYGIPTVQLGIQTTQFHQGFGGLALNETTLPLFVRGLCELFAVDDIEQIKGRKCVALWSFGEWNEPIEGLEVDGRRFTITGFRRRAHPELDTDKLAAKKRELRRAVEHHKRMLSEAKARLDRFSADGYVDWESGGPCPPHAKGTER